MGEFINVLLHFDTRVNLYLFVYNIQPLFTAILVYTVKHAHSFHDFHEIWKRFFSLIFFLIQVLFKRFWESNGNKSWSQCREWKTNSDRSAPLHTTSIMHTCVLWICVDQKAGHYRGRSLMHSYHSGYYLWLEIRQAVKFWAIISKNRIAFGNVAPFDIDSFCIYCLL